MRNVMKLLLVFLVIFCAVYPVEAKPRLRTELKNKMHRLQPLWT